MRKPFWWRSFIALGLCLCAVRVRSDGRSLPLTADILAGAWKLVSIEYSGSAGPERDPLFWPHSSGIIVYDRSGWMSVQISGPDRPMLEDEARTSGSVAKDPVARTLAFETYYAYSGTWTFDEATSAVTHHIRMSLLPYEVGKDYRRLVSFDGRHLTLTVDPGQDRGRGKQVNRRVLTWERIDPSGR